MKALNKLTVQQINKKENALFYPKWSIIYAIGEIELVVIGVRCINDSLTSKVINNEVMIKDYYKEDRLGDLLVRVQLLTDVTQTTELQIIQSATC